MSYGKRGKRAYYKRRSMRKKYTGVKYFTERIQYPNIAIPASSSTFGNYSTFKFDDLGNNLPIGDLFSQFSVVSLQWEIRPINTYVFGTSPVPAPNMTYALEDNPDEWTSPTAKTQLLETNRSRTRTLDCNRTPLIKTVQKLPTCSANEQESIGGVQVNIQQPGKRKFQWYAINDLTGEAAITPQFGALRYWVELPSGTVGNQPLEVAEHYLTIRYAVKDQQ